jgi:hypothetical protein
LEPIAPIATPTHHHPYDMRSDANNMATVSAVEFLSKEKEALE